MDTLDHEHLDVFELSLDFACAADLITHEQAGGRSDLADQLRRASSSILLNIAEGAGEFAPKEKARLYRLARRSASESAAIIALYRRLRLIEDSRTSASRAMLIRIVAMLVRLVQSAERDAAAQQTAIKTASGRRRAGPPSTTTTSSPAP